MLPEEALRGLVIVDQRLSLAEAVPLALIQPVHVRQRLALRRSTMRLAYLRWVAVSIIDRLRGDGEMLYAKWVFAACHGKV